MAKARKIDEWEARDAMHTLMRAGEITKDKALLEAARKQAADHSKKMAEVAQRAGQLAKRGMISDKQMAKMSGKSAANKGQGGKTAELEKTAPIA
jgi:hypothetical protein